MSLRDGPLSDIKPPLTWLAVAALAIAVIVTLVIFAGGRRGHAPAQAATTRPGAEGALGGVGAVLSWPIHWFGGVAETGQDYVFAGFENRQLKTDLRAALSWRDEALALRDENARYRALLGVRTDPPIPMVFGRTVLDARGPFANTRIADVGSDKGVAEGNPALGEHGLVGRVIGVSGGASRIMMLTDLESRTPVLIPRTNGRAILTGDGGGNPKLDYLRTHDALREGDRVLTSGDGGVLPRGLPVGDVVKGVDGAWRVALDSDASPIDFVEILLFKDFSQLTPTMTLAPSALPSTATGAPTPPPAAMATAKPPPGASSSVSQAPTPAGPPAARPPAAAASPKPAAVHATRPRARSSTAAPAPATADGGAPATVP